MKEVWDPHCWTIKGREKIFGPNPELMKTSLGRPFRLLDGDDEVYFLGEMYSIDPGSETDFAPLDDFGAGFGCTSIQYKGETGWETL